MKILDPIVKRVIVDYRKLNEDILTLLVEKFPEGYDESNIITYRNAQYELVEAVEVRSEDTIYLVKVSKRLADSMESFESDEEDEEVAFEKEEVDFEMPSSDNDFD